MRVLIFLILAFVFSEAHYGAIEYFTSYKTNSTLDTRAFTVGETLQLDVYFLDYTSALISRNSLVLVHNRLLHLIIISNNMEFMTHIHPEDFNQTTDTRFTFVINLAKAGNYTLGADFMLNTTDMGIVPADGVLNFVAQDMGYANTSFDRKPIMQLSPVQTVTGLPLDAKDSYAHQIRLPDMVSTSGWTITFIVNGGIKYGYGGCVAFIINVKNSDGTPATGFVPWLSAAAHIAFLQHDVQDFVYHTHAMINDNTMMHNMSCIGHVMPVYGPNDPIGTDLMAVFQFPRPGLWQAFVQMKHSSGKLVTSYFTLSVGDFIQPTSVHMHGGETSPASVVLPSVFLALLMILSFHF